MTVSQARLLTTSWWHIVEALSADPNLLSDRSRRGLKHSKPYHQVFASQDIQDYRTEPPVPANRLTIKLSSSVSNLDGSEIFCHPDPDLKNLDPDMSVFALVYSKSTNKNVYKSLTH